jgi:hypothetical protein
MTDNVLQVFTSKSVETMLEVGGTQSWALDRNRAKGCKYVVMCRNAYHPDVEGPEAHKSAFMVGKITDVVPATEETGRWLVLFDEYSVINVGYQWEGRNPVRFYTTDEYEGDIDFDTLKWTPMPERSAQPAKVTPKPKTALTITEAKAGLAQTFGVDPSAIEIMIRG